MNAPDYSHDYPGDDSHEHERTFDDLGYPVTVRLSAVGGGTVGRYYRHQAWHYAIVGPSGKVLARGSDLYTPGPIDHAAAAYTAYTFYRYEETDQP